MGTFLIIQWLGLSTSTVGGMGSFPDQGTKILHATLHGQNPKQQQKQTNKAKQHKTKITLILCLISIEQIFYLVILSVQCWNRVRFCRISP